MIGKTMINCNLHYWPTLRVQNVFEIHLVGILADQTYGTKMTSSLCFHFKPYV